MSGALSAALLRGPVLAHGGGLPEAATVLTPLLALGLFVALQVRARRRERSAGETGAQAGPDRSEADTPR